MCDWIIAERTRCIKRLAELDPASEEYGRIVGMLSFNLGGVEYDMPKTEQPKTEQPKEVPAHVKQAVAEAMELLPVEEPTPFDTPTAPMEPAKTYDKEEVRAALAEGRKHGIKVSDLLNEMGYGTFTAIPASEYPEIMKRLGTA